MHAHRIASNQNNLPLSLIRERGFHVGIVEWLLGWLIVNALFVVCRALAVSYEMKTRVRPVREEDAGQPLSQEALQRRRTIIPGTRVRRP
jgi:hypothetical protein